MSVIKKMIGRTLQQAQVREHYVNLSGGLNLVGDILSLRDGEALTLLNYEINPQGRYQSIQGIERFDGQPTPSEVDLDPASYADEESYLSDLIIQRETRRTAINVVPGSGPIRGITCFNGIVLAFRDSVDGSELNLYKSSPTGWTQITTPLLQPGGKFEFCEIHYAGRARELVGVDGINKAFVWDGAAFSQIDNTGMGADDKPTHVASLPEDILLLSYSGGSLQYSAIGDPTNFIDSGAGEINFVSEIVGIGVQAKDSFAVFCQDKTYLVRGRVPTQWTSDELFSDVGAVEGSIQSVGDSIYLSPKGLTRLSRVQQFGDFDSVPMAMQAQPLFNSALQELTCSCVLPQKNQYRLYLANGAGICVTLSGSEVLGVTQLSYGTDKVLTCITRTNDETKLSGERIFAGSENGFVYELDVGTSIDGEPIETTLRPTFTSFSSEAAGWLGVDKRLVDITAFVQASSEITLSAVPSFNYESTDSPEGEFAATVAGEGAYFGSGVFDLSFWSNAIVQYARFPFKGRAETFTVLLTSASTLAGPHVLTSLRYRYIPLARSRY